LKEKQKQILEKQRSLLETEEPSLNNNDSFTSEHRDD